MRPARRPIALTIQPLEDRTAPAALRGDPTEFRADRIIVRIRDDASPPPGTPARSLGGQGLYAAAVPAGRTVAESLAEFGRIPEVAYAEPDYRVYAERVPNDPRFRDGTLWGLHNAGQFGGKPDADIDAREAWNTITDASDVVVAVIDTGADYTHPDLAANMWTNPDELPGNGLDDDANGYIDDVHGYDFHDADGDPQDDVGHGTHVAGTIAARGNNGIGVTGVAWRARLMAVRFLSWDGGFMSDAIESLNYAVANGAAISNNSWGGLGFSQGLLDAITAARDAGHLYVAAAGNGGSDRIGDDTDSIPFYPAGLPADNVIAVAALDRRDRLANFSNYGDESVDLGAPGVGVFSTIPGGYEADDGTSMATPHVSGALALLKSQHPDWTADKLKARLLDTVTPIPALAGKTVTGGRLNLATLVDGGGPGGGAGPLIVNAVAPLADTAGRVNAVRVEFSDPISPQTFKRAGVRVTGPTGERIGVGRIRRANSDGTQFDVFFRPQVLSGPAGLRIHVSPTVESDLGIPLDQDKDGAPGEFGEDQYVSHAFAFAVTGGPIPDGGTAEFPLTVGRSLNLTDVNVWVDLAHPYVGDLRLELVSPAGTVVPLLDQQGADGDDLAGTWFDAHAAALIAKAAAPFHGSYRPIGDLSTLSGEDAAGEWKFRVTDLYPGAAGTLNGWGVHIGTDTAHAAVTVDAVRFLKGDAEWPEGVEVDFSAPVVGTSISARDVRVIGPTGRPVRVRSVVPREGTHDNTYVIRTHPMLTAGTYAIRVGPAVADEYGSPMDTNGNLLFGESADAGVHYLVAPEHAFRWRASKPRALLDSGTVTATLAVRKAVTIDRLRVGLDMSHTRDSDLRVTLVSPAGTRAVLIDRRGGDGDNFTRTVLSDDAALDLASGAAPFRGEFRPESPLAAVAGQVTRGRWKLIIEDVAQGDIGRLLSWALYVTPAV
jgi:serine protease